MICCKLHKDDMKNLVNMTFVRLFHFEDYLIEIKKEGDSDGSLIKNYY